MKDYAKKNYVRPNKKGKSRLFLFISIVFISIVVAYSLHFFQKHHLKKLAIEHKTRPVQSTKIEIPTKTIKEKPSTVPKTNITSKSTAPDFNFSFYKMLPKMSVSTPKIQTSTKHEPINEAKQYFLQVASSKDKDGTDILIKQLSEHGFPTVVSSTVRRHTRWYHIFLGPYTYLNQAKDDQYRLYRDFHMNGILQVVKDKKTT